jgi:putative photosynthetic complex assembly protein 2
MGAPAAIGYAIGLWWFSTGLILFLNHLTPRSFRASMLAASVLAIACLAGIRATSGLSTQAGAYAGFTYGVLVWGWHEMAFFMGFVTGPRRTAGPPSRGLQRFVHATQTCIYHEIAIALTAIAVFALCAGGPNHVAAWTFCSLWVMRLSAKFNVFLGVRNLNEQFVPRRLQYLVGYMRRAPMNWLLPFSVGGGMIAAYAFARLAAPGAAPLAATGGMLVAALLVLAVIEHAVMVIPIPFERLWSAFRRCPAEVTRREGLMLSEGLAAACPVHLLPAPTPRS